MTQTPVTMGKRIGKPGKTLRRRSGYGGVLKTLNMSVVEAPVLSLEPPNCILDPKFKCCFFERDEGTCGNGVALGGE
jgi:hypothetical protein